MIRNIGETGNQGVVIRQRINIFKLRWVENLTQRFNGENCKISNILERAGDDIKADDAYQFNAGAISVPLIICLSHLRQRRG